MSNRNTKKIFAIIAIAVVVIAGAAYLFKNIRDTSMSQIPVPAETNAEKDIRAVVIAFGEKLHLVDITAPKAVAVKAITEQYGPFASSTLMAAWIEDPERAPGKFRSDSLPEKIVIDLIEPEDDGAYVVQARVIESAFEYQVAIKLRNQDGKWLITGFTKNIPL